MERKIIRKVDEIGRVVLPKDVRDNFEIATGSELEIIQTEEGILLKKHAPECIFCGCTENIIMIKDRPVCENCVSGIKQLKSNKE